MYVVAVVVVVGMYIGVGGTVLRITHIIAYYVHTYTITITITI